ncbi:MAG: hypothetical protein HUU55_07465 [Myxococcales bacterium]|nr:hypothetical protein [Myxococcales bacterium]
MLRLEPVWAVLVSAGVLHPDSTSGRTWLGLVDGSRPVRTVLVAGTNGKGSTVAFIEAILRHAGFTTGAYLSPYLEDPGDSTWVNGRPVGTDSLLRALEDIEKLGGNISHLTSFEKWTAATFFFFAHHRVDWAVIEVGLGGRLDATNVIDPDLSVITNVSLDHQRFLGNSLEEIVWEKGGIVRSQTPLVTGLSHTLYSAAIRDRSPPVAVKFLGDSFSAGTTDGNFWYRDAHCEIAGAGLGIGGGFQVANAALAVATCRLAVTHLSVDAVICGLRDAKLPGRWEVHRGHPTVVLDGAHNEAGARAVAVELESALLPRPWIWLWACRRDRDPRLVARHILPYMDRVITTSVPCQYTWDASDLVGVVPLMHAGVQSEPVQDPVDALQRARVVAGPDGTVFVVGSLYLIGAVYRQTLASTEQVGCKL